MANASTPGILKQYPSPPGAKNRTCATIAGPSSYTQISSSAGTAVTGGQTVKATDLGLSDFDFFHGSTSDDGIYATRVYYPNQNPAIPVQQVQVQWYTISTGTEVSGNTDLSGRSIRVITEGGS